MRVSALLALTLALAALPYLSGVRVLSVAGPRSSVFLALVSLLGLSTSGLFTLAALLDPSDLPARTLPDVVSRCLDATATILAHPVGHWPRIAGALLLASLLVRAAYGTAATLRNTTRGMPSADARQRIIRVAGIGNPVIVLDGPAVLAYTVGILRPRVVISDGLLDTLDRDEVRAVLAHEGAHASGRHTALLFFGRATDRAFGFLPPIRRAVKQLTLGLEVIADDRAIDRVGDPLIVANALASFAAPSRVSPADALGAAEREVLYRVKRLSALARSRSPRRRRFAPAVCIMFGILLFLGQLLALPASGRAMSARSQASEVHGVCHLPHAADGS